MTDAAMASLSSSVQALAERLASTTASRGRAEGDYIDIDTLVPYSVPEFIDLTKSSLRLSWAILLKKS
jgi:hypothetical protein